MTRTSSATEMSRLLRLIAAVVAIAALYFFRIVFIPIALALLFSVLLTPAVTLLEKIKLPRILAIFAVVICVMGLLGFVGWKSSQQLALLTNQLPEYKQTLIEKIDRLKKGRSATLDNASNTVKELANEIGAAEGGKNGAGPGSSVSRPLPVEVVPSVNPIESIENIFGPLVSATAIVIFTIFILASREDLRNRLIRLASGGRLTVVTQAMDEATSRINRYLFLQFLVNSCYGLVIFIALHFIGIPDASLWGVSAAVLRFVPYAGPPIGALMPIVLSLAVFPGWQYALATAGVFLVLEVSVANFVEPLLYGARLGLAPLAILVAAVFWTMIWGFPGLVLSTPLTVCLVVAGRYVPSLEFLNVLLGDEPVLPAEAQYYQRLLATDQNDAKRVLEESLKDKSLEELYESVLIPALGLSEQDRHKNELDEETQNFIYQSTREIVEELEETAEEVKSAEGHEAAAAEIFGARREYSEGIEILCIPARDDADDVVALLLAQILTRRGHLAMSIPIGSTVDMLSQVKEMNPQIVCISALPPFAINHARALYGKLRLQSPNLHVVICLWHFEGDALKAAARLNVARSHALFTKLSEVSKHVEARLAAPVEVLQ